MKLFAMKILIWTASVWAVAATAAAETAYITDIIRVSVRSGPSNDQKFVAGLESGQMVNIVKAGEEWTLVRMPNGTEGYLQSRFLTSQPPTKLRFDQLQEKNKNLTGQVAGLMEENQRLKADSEKLATTIAAERQQIASLKSEFEAFKKEAAHVTELQAKYDASKAELAEKQDEIIRLENQAQELLNPKNIYWFLAGAGVLLAGFLIGFSIKRKRRWSSLD
jgi:SH3 domain protein